MTVLDIGCNGGFYSIEMKRRGADRVVAIDTETMYLHQARFAAEMSWRRRSSSADLSVYDVAKLGERFDLVIFMGVLYHLRHPLLALDLIHDHVARDLLLFQSMQRGSADVEPLEPDYPIDETEDSSTGRVIRSSTSSSIAIPTTTATGGFRTAPASKPCSATAASTIEERAGGGSLSLPTASNARHPAPAAVYPARGQRMIEAAMIWNEPNNKSHWDPELDPDWAVFARDGGSRGPAIAAENPAIARVLGGISPIDPRFIAKLGGAGRARSPGRGGGARLSARLEPVADRRMAGQAERDRSRAPTCRSG